MASQHAGRPAMRGGPAGMAGGHGRDVLPREHHKRAKSAFISLCGGNTKAHTERIGRRIGERASLLAFHRRNINSRKLGKQDSLVSLFSR